MDFFNMKELEKQAVLALVTLQVKLSSEKPDLIVVEPEINIQEIEPVQRKPKVHKYEDVLQRKQAKRAQNRQASRRYRAKVTTNMDVVRKELERLERKNEKLKQEFANIVHDLEILKKCPKCQ